MPKGGEPEQDSLGHLPVCLRKQDAVNVSLEKEGPPVGLRVAS